MKASLFFAFVCLAAIAVSTVSAKSIEDVPEVENVEEAGNAGDIHIQPLDSCRLGRWACILSCNAQGRNNGYCNSEGTCICTN